MKNFKKTAKQIAALGLAATASLTFMTSCGQESPIATIESGITTLTDNIKEDYSVINTLADASNGGSIQINMSLDEILKDAAGIELEDIDGSVTMYYGENETMVNAAAKLNGVSVIDADVYMDDEGFAIASDAIFGEDVAYGSAYEGMDERFENSIFASGQAYGDIGSMFSGVIGYLSKTGSVLAMKNDLTVLWGELKDDIYTAIEENTDSSVEKGDYPTDSGTVKTHNVSIIAEDEQFADVVIAVIDVLLNSDDFEEFCNTHKETIEEFTDISDPIAKLEELKTEVDDARGDTEGCKAEIFAAIGRSSKELVALEIKVENADSETAYVQIEIAPSSDKLESITVIASDNSSETKLEYTVTEATKTAYSSKFEIDGEEVFDYSWDKSTGDFKLKIYDDTATVKGNISAGKKESTITVSSIEVDEEKFEFEKLEIIIKASDTMPAAIDDYKDIMTITEDELEAIVNDVVELFNEYLPN